MPQISVATPLDEFGNVNPDVPENTISVAGSGFSPNTTLNVFLNGSGVKTLQTDKNGNLNFTYTATDSTIKSKFQQVGCGGDWDDKSTTWVIDCGDFNITMSL